MAQSGFNAKQCTNVFVLEKLFLSSMGIHQRPLFRH